MNDVFGSKRIRTNCYQRSFVQYKKNNKWRITLINWNDL